MASIIIKRIIVMVVKHKIIRGIVVIKRIEVVEQEIFTFMAIKPRIIRGEVVRRVVIGRFFINSSLV